MKSNKVAMIIAAFALPDDFDGDALDALKLAAEYHEKKGRGRARIGEPYTGELEKAWELLFANHTDILWEDGNEDRISAVVSLQQYDTEKEIWKDVAVEK